MGHTADRSLAGDEDAMPVEDPLYRLCYASTQTAPMSAAELIDLLHFAREHNLANGITGVLLAHGTGDSWPTGGSQLWPLLLLMMFSEGFINGLCISAMAVFFPHWLKTFDERFYLDED